MHSTESAQCSVAVPAKRSTRGLVALVPVLLIAALGHLHYANVTIDDAFISFRYAENLVRGHGLVFNVGERVEGYSNFLWTLLLAVPLWLGVDRFELGMLVTAKALGAVLNLGTLVLLWRTTALGRPDERPSVLAPLYLATLAPLLVWGVSGLETSLVTLLIFGALHLHLREELAFRAGREVVPWSFVVLALAALTRPEPAILLVPLVALRLNARLRDSGKWRELRRELLRVGWFALPYGAFLLWRIGYYGELLPNTYYAKMHDDPDVLARGWRYLTGAARDLGWGWPAACGGLALLIARGRAPHRVVATSAFLLTLLAAIWWEGGDWMPARRTLVPALPLVALLMHEVWRACGKVRPKDLAFGSTPAWVAPRSWIDRWNRALARASARPNFRSALGFATHAALAGALTASALSSHSALHMQAASGLRENQLGTGLHFQAARWMQRELPRPGLLALGEAGVIPYLTKFPVLDLFGLTDPHIARQQGSLHMKFDADYVLRRNPAYVFLIARPSEQGGWFSDHHHATVLLEDARFTQRYREIQRFDGAVLFARADGVESANVLHGDGRRSTK